MSEFLKCSFEEKLNSRLFDSFKGCQIKVSLERPPAWSQEAYRPWPSLSAGAPPPRPGQDQRIPPIPREQTHTCENITPPLRTRVVEYQDGERISLDDVRW